MGHRQRTGQIRYTAKECIAKAGKRIRTADTTKIRTKLYKNMNLKRTLAGRVERQNKNKDRTRIRKGQGH